MNRGCGGTLTPRTWRLAAHFPTASSIGLSGRGNGNTVQLRCFSATQPRIRSSSSLTNCALICRMIIPAARARLRRAEKVALHRMIEICDRAPSGPPSCCCGAGAPLSSAIAARSIRVRRRKARASIIRDLTAERIPPEQQVQPPARKHRPAALGMVELASGAQVPRGRARRHPSSVPWPPKPPFRLDP